MQIMQVVLLSFILTFLASVLLTPLVRRLAASFNVCAFPNHRTIHHRIVPKLGGVAIYSSFVSGIAVAFWLYYGSLEPFQPHVAGLILGASLMLLLGILDDVRGVSCYYKLMIQSVAALVAIHYGYQISSIRTPFGGTIFLGSWSVPLTVLWIVGISNAINLIDGLDGLAAGISLGVTFTFFLIALLFGDIEVMFESAIRGAVMAGFLTYNFNPATNCMGDG